MLLVSRMVSLQSSSTGLWEAVGICSRRLKAQLHLQRCGKGLYIMGQSPMFPHATWTEPLGVTSWRYPVGYIVFSFRPHYIAQRITSIEYPSHKILGYWITPAWCLNRENICRLQVTLPFGAKSSIKNKKRKVKQRQGRIRGFFQWRLKKNKEAKTNESSSLSNVNCSYLLNSSNVPGTASHSSVGERDWLIGCQTLRYGMVS